MFSSLGGPEIILIFIVALIVFGPKRLPEIGRKVGGWVREFRRATGDFRTNIEREIGFDPVTGVETTKRVRRDMLSAVSAPIREIAEETVETARKARELAEESFRTPREPRILPPAAPPIPHRPDAPVPPEGEKGRDPDDTGGQGA